MKRRTLLKSVLALPLVNRTVSAATPSTTSQTAAHASDALYSGLAGLDYAMGGLKSGEMSCFFGPPCMGKTMLLLELAARLVGRYGQNVYLHGVHQPSVYLSGRFRSVAIPRSISRRFETSSTTGTKAMRVPVLCFSTHKVTRHR